MPNINPRADLAGRETRQFVVDTIEARSNDDGAVIGMSGYASVTEQSYVVTDWLGEYDEVIRAGAFAKTLRDQDDVRLLVNHSGIPLARTKYDTLQLREVVDGKKDPQKKGQTGLWTEADFDLRSNLANDVTVALDRGDLDQMSFAFQVIRQEWSPDFTQRDILEVRLFDVSVVTYPASELTSAGLRNLNLDRVSDDEARELLQRLEARLAPQTQPGPSAALLRLQADALRARSTA